MAVLRPFETEIIEKFKTFSVPEARGGKATPRKGVWIRGHLLDVKSGYVYSMFKSWRLFCRLAEELMGVRIEAGTYQDFRTYFHLLKQLGLVRVYTEYIEKGRRTVHYEAVPGRLRDPAWTRPFQTKYPETDWTIKTAKEKARLRKKYPRRRRRAGS